MKDDKEQFIIKRVFDAPSEQVWKAWTDPAIVKRWWVTESLQHQA